MITVVYELRATRGRAGKLAVKLMKMPLLPDVLTVPAPDNGTDDVSVTYKVSGKDEALLLLGAIRELPEVFLAGMTILNYTGEGT